MASSRYRLRRPYARLLVGLCFGLTGCGGAFRLPFKPAPATQSRPTTSEVDLWHLPPPVNGTWIYERQQQNAEQNAPRSLYVKQLKTGLQTEGALITRRFLPLTTYIRRPEMSPEQMNALPKAPLLGYAAVIVELDQPMPYYPATIRLGETVTNTSPIGCYDRLGRKFFPGTVQRTATAECYEDVTCPAGEFKQCKRMRIELKFRFPLAVSTDVTEYRWFADGVGEVRRLEHLTCVILVFWMEATYDYRLVSYFLDHPESQPTEPPPRDWTCIAALFDRTFPHPRLSGMHVELTSGLTFNPATRPTRQ